jgi:hypothetical protein
LASPGLKQRGGIAPNVTQFIHSPAAPSDIADSIVGAQDLFLRK